MKDIIDRLILKFNAKNVRIQHPSHAFISVDKKDLEGCVLYLKEFGGYGHLTFISAVDWIERNEFELIYHLHNYTDRTDISIKTFISRNDPSMVSLNTLWAGAKVYEREIREMFGIDFPGCPRVNENFALEGWQDIPPMRRDFDTKKYSDGFYEERPGRSTKRNTAQMEEKLYPVEAEVKKGTALTVRNK